MGDSRYVYKNELDKACFQYDISYAHFKDLARRTASDKVLRDKAFDIVKNSKYHGYQRGVASMVYKFFDKKSSGRANKSMQNQKLTNELHKPVIRNFKKRTVYSSFKDNIWGADLTDVQLISKFNKGIRFYYVLLTFIVNVYGLFL